MDLLARALSNIGLSETGRPPRIQAHLTEDVKVILKYIAFHYSEPYGRVSSSWALQLSG